MNSFLSLIIYSSVGAITPGPNNFACMNNALRMGLRKSIGYNWGVFGGYLALNLLCILFSAPLYQAFPFVKPYIQALGAAYLLWMAYQVLRSSGKGKQAALNIPHTFWPAFFFQFMNPKSLFYSMSTIAMFILPNFKGLLVPVLLVFLTSFIGFACTFVWSFFGTAFQKIFATHEKLINGVMAALLLYCALSLYL